jgi:hypothetical protein
VKVVPLAGGSHLVAAMAKVLARRHLPTHLNVLEGKLCLPFLSAVAPAALHIAMPLDTATIEVYLREYNMAFSAWALQTNIIPPKTSATFSSNLLAAARHHHFHRVMHGTCLPTICWCTPNQQCSPSCQRLWHVPGISALYR